MKATLIAPRMEEEKSYEEDPKPLFPPLSLMTVASLTPEDVEVEIIDESVEPIDFNTDADLIGITATTAAANRAYEIADCFRKRGKCVVIGGVHATALPDEAAEHADAVVIGEAEGKWEALIEDFRRDELRKFYTSEDRPNPECIPVPRRDLVKAKKYLFADTVQTTRGCPFNCSFCTVTSFFGHTYRMRPVQAVIQEIQSLPGSLVLIVDDNIMGHPTYAKKLFEALKPLKKQWFGQASLSMLKHPELISLAAESGCKGLFIGMETLSDDALKSIGKTINRKTNYEEVVARLHDVGIAVLAAFIFGFDEDDPNVFERTVEFVNRAKIDAAQFSILTPFPGTRIFHEFEKENRIIDKNWSHYDGAHVVYKPARLKPETLLEGLRNAYRQVYSTGSILRRLGPALKIRFAAIALNTA
ncbi:MAG: radical SAM protein, partial [Armatimonadota bacterium]|nr:radical SAM protein [Armatimonadota bacterium]